MKILVTGRSGQVARSLAARGSPNDLVFTSREMLDLADPASIERAVAAVGPDLVVSAGAYTAVDKAESEPDLALAINGEGPGVLARAAARHDAAIIHLSSDYVFDGGLDRPWREDDAVAPINVYGETKLAGEQAVAASGARHAIIRTSWVYSPFGHNFVATMLRLADGGGALNVVDDQIGCPTSALDIADGIGRILNMWERDPAIGANEVFHLAGTGEASWADFARRIFHERGRRGGTVPSVTGIPTAAYPTAARRPANSRLDSTKFADVFGYCAPRWQQSLGHVMDGLMPPAASGECY